MGTESSLHRLVTDAQLGNEGSFRTLYSLYAPKARGTLRQMVGPTHLDDLVQEVFVRVWKGFPKMKDANAFSTWFYRITWNVAMDARSHAAHLRERESQNLDLEFADPKSPKAESIHNRILVERALKQLSKEHRDVLVLSDFEELSTEEIAGIMAVPAGTVKSRLFHARESVRNFLTARGVKL
jgi:RNA polymerase sigma-70 factor (ECF subfamily)